MRTKSSAEVSESFTQKPEIFVPFIKSSRSFCAAVTASGERVSVNPCGSLGCRPNSHRNHLQAKQSPVEMLSLITASAWQLFRDVRCLAAAFGSGTGGRVATECLGLLI